MSALKEFHRSNLCAECCYKCVYEFLMTITIYVYLKHPNLYLYLCCTCCISDAYELALYLFSVFNNFYNLVLHTYTLFALYLCITTYYI